MSIIVTTESGTGRLLRWLFSPPPLGNLPVKPSLVPLSGFAVRLAKHPIDLVTHLGMTRANAYFAAGCPLELCDHAAARDLWNVIHAVRRATDLNPEPEPSTNAEVL